ncbi:hypothetical protein OUZ56_027953 [Daphnia magna]|uniref:Uncharacterized protein n=1 Tax=Daphnia magna TaxID=35525 RepID=A0ABR0B2F2_9CRUS|nr:hypothetical protein OUZ56_027953 [Daphnia magna]
MKAATTKGWTHNTPEALTWATCAPPTATRQVPKDRLKLDNQVISAISRTVYMATECMNRVPFWRSNG